MGIKSFTKVFEYTDEFAYKNFKNKNVVIDGFMELYRAALGLKTINALTDSTGKPTAHINTILLGVVLKLKAAGANQYWVFDYNTHAENSVENHNPLKQLELAKRKLKKTVAQDNIKRLTSELENKAIIKDELFSEDEDEEDQNEQDKKPSGSKVAQSQIEIQNEINKQQKAAFTLKSFYIEDVKFILDMLDIPWIECPAGFDAEQIAAFSTTNSNILGVKMDYVLSQDMDSLLFGARVLIKRDLKKKKLFKYELSKILKDYKLTHNDLIKVSLILGTDFAEKTPKIGPKTVLKKYGEVVLSDEQKKAYNDNFKRQLTNEELKSIKIMNSNVEPFKKYDALIDWIVMIKGFNRDRITKQFNKIDLFI
jgi:hypothetical protein